MTGIRALIHRLRTSSDRGATAVEYGLIVALFVLGMIGVVGVLNTALTATYNSTEGKVAAPQSRLAPPSNPPYTPPVCTVDQWYNGLTGLCDPKTVCVGGQTFNNSDNTCTEPVCSGSQWYNAATHTCDTAVVCVGEQTFNSGDNTCSEPVCSGEWFNAVAHTCDPIPVCVGEQSLNSGTNTCVDPVCSGEWFNAAAHTCDPIVTCTIGEQVRDDATNTCVDPVCSGEWFNTSAHTCDAFTTCATDATWSSTTNQCTTMPPISRCYSNNNGRTATYNVMSGYSLATARLTGVTDPGLTGDTNPSIVSGNVNISYKTPSTTTNWPLVGGVRKITITFEFSVSYVQNGVTIVAKRTGTFTITRLNSGGSANPTGTNC